MKKWCDEHEQPFCGCDGPKSTSVSAVASNDGLVLLLEWAIKEREELEKYVEEKNKWGKATFGLWGEIDRLVKIENKIIELQQKN